jgi:hypothetical protein
VSSFARHPLEFACRPLEFARCPLEFACRPLEFARCPLEFARRPLEFARRPLEFARHPLLLDANLPLEDCRPPFAEWSYVTIFLIWL